jgi:helicase
MINHFQNGGKTIYIVPLKSLGSEKFKSFKEDYSPYGVRVGLSISDLDSGDYKLSQYDVIICTAEKADSLIRHDANFIRKVSCIIIDEVHLIDDYSRGPTLEVLITILRKLLPKAQLIALSATISNDSEIANGWRGIINGLQAVKLMKSLFEWKTGIK